MNKLSNYQKKKYCVGCRNNFYNGNNQYGIKECWLLKDAKVVWMSKSGYYKMDFIKNEKIRTLNCFHGK